ncbi:hypothetical protein JW721_01395 [Candidatus Micrarchaeota archaeon]|nr:hypothetical protein [Candidatus Micrarchaeota archaeon]
MPPKSSLPEDSDRDSLQLPVADFLDFLRKGVRGKCNMYSRRNELYE